MTVYKWLRSGTLGHVASMEDMSNMQAASHSVLVLCLAAVSGGCFGLDSTSTMRGARVYGSDQFVAGRLSEYPVGTRTALETRGVFVFHDARGFQVMEAVCTYRESVLYWNEALQQAKCPRCQSIYGRRGNVVQGPAVKPLSFYYCAAGKDHLLVDRTRLVDAQFFAEATKNTKPK